MKPNFLYALALFAGASFATAQAKLTPEEFVLEALNNSAAVRAAESAIRASDLSARSAGTTASPQIELTPTIGTINGNALLSQDLDLFGRRRTHAALLRSEYDRQVVQSLAVRVDVVESALRALIAWHSAEIKLTEWRRAEQSAQALLSATRKGLEIGEVPQVHVTRAELELLRTSQAVVRAESRKRVAQQEIESLIGKTIVASDLPLMDALLLTPAELKQPRSIEILVAQRDSAYAKARIRSARADSRPSISAGLTADFRSLDGRTSDERMSSGIQLVLRSPLFDFGENRLQVKAEEASVAAANDRLTEAERVAQLRLQQALSERQSAQAILAAYEGEIAPKSEGMLKAMQEGYAAGLLTLVEVIEAQQALSDLKQEQAEARTEVWLAELALRRALLQFPGLEVPR